MTVRELNREQLIELKESFLDNYLMEVEDRTASYGELANADSIVSDDEVFRYYEGVDFVPDDFCCTYW